MKKVQWVITLVSEVMCFSASKYSGTMLWTQGRAIPRVKDEARGGGCYTPSLTVSKKKIPCVIMSFALLLAGRPKTALEWMIPDLANSQRDEQKAYLWGHGLYGVSGLVWWCDSFTVDLFGHLFGAQNVRRIFETTVLLNTCMKHQHRSEILVLMLLYVSYSCWLYCGHLHCRPKNTAMHSLQHVRHSFTLLPLLVTHPLTDLCLSYVCGLLSCMHPVLVCVYWRALLVFFPLGMWGTEVMTAWLYQPLALLNNKTLTPTDSLSEKFSARFANDTCRLHISFIRYKHHKQMRGYEQT